MKSGACHHKTIQLACFSKTTDADAIKIKQPVGVV
jgi:hypothetical protein